MSLNHATVALDEINEEDMEKLTGEFVNEPHLVVLQRRPLDDNSMEKKHKSIVITGSLSISF